MFDNVLMLLGIRKGLAGYTIWSRIKGRLGYRTAVDSFADMYGLVRVKGKYIYESNNSLKERIIESIRRI